MLTEYGDYQCPFCAAAHVVVEEVLASAGDVVRFAFRHFPLTTIHPNAFGAAEAAEAAGAQGQFWPMHDLLFADQQHLDPPALLARAEFLGLDVDRFETELFGHAHADKVQADFLSGVHSGVRGTPTFFINGVRHEGPADFVSLMSNIKAALARP
jgi:protein-disulfide isomerase